MKINKGDIVPKDSFDAIKIWIPEIDKEALIIEYRNFSVSFNKLQLEICPEKLYNVDFYESTSEDDCEINSENRDEEIDSGFKKKYICNTNF